MDDPEPKDQCSTREGLPTYARVENLGRYAAGGFHPIHLGDHIGPDERFEVHHKLGYSDACTVWLCLDRQNDRPVGVKILQAEKSTESHPEVAALGLFKGIDQQELQSNHIFTVDEHFWIDGPNGRHLCLVVQVLGPAISYSLRGIDLDTPDLLTDLCFQAAQCLKYLHDKKICHGDFRPDNMRLQLDLDAMSTVNVYELFGEPRVWHLKGSREGNNDKRPRYLVEPVSVASVESKYRTGQIAIDNFSASNREDDAIDPQIFDTHYTAPEIRFLKKSSGFSSDIWSLASTIHFVRTTKLLLARLNSRSSLVSWLAWVCGPFPQNYWTAVGEYLSSDSAIPVFAVNTIPQKLPETSKGHSTQWADTEPDSYPVEWGRNRSVVVGILLGEEETPRSIEYREVLQQDKDRSKYLRIKLPKHANVWAKFQGQRKQLTGFRSLLHEDLSKERQWYQDTDALKGSDERYVPDIGPGSIDKDTLQRLNGTWIPVPAPEIAAEEATGSREGNAGAPDELEKRNGKRLLAEEGRETQPNPKKTKTFVAEHNLRDQVECVEQRDGMTKFSYRLQLGEVDLLASLLRDMLKNDPGERISADEVVRHEWFDGSRRRLERR
ncbi:kinase-like domain-containing protein [Ustulina deusta]|nr:kinase-like domain-containing protein [Ustulina deusta]